ncbi:MAG: PASTA domain-containing protein [Gaiellaceae bacterium]
MASDTERQAAEDTIVADAAQLGAGDDEWPVAELYRVQSEDGGGEDRAAEDGVFVLTVPADTSPASARRGRPGLGIALLAIMLVVGAIILAAVVLASPGDGQSPRRSASATSATPLPTQATLASPTNTLPSLEGMTVADALLVLKEMRLRAQVRTTSSERPRGIVLRQEPPGGTGAVRVDVVTLVVSSGSATDAVTTVSVPPVVGRSASDAVAELRGAGFVAKIRLVTSTGRAGLVVRQSPAGAAQAKRGSTVRLAVSKPRDVPQRIEVPDVVGLDAAEARQRLTELGLTVKVVREASPQPVDTVLHQSPRPSARLLEKARVTLTVSSGPQRIDVPDVVGLVEESARAELESAGLDVTVTYEPTSDPAEDGSVVRQTPVGGSSAAASTVVTIVVAQLR